jgi:hypothetical protein
MFAKTDSWSRLKEKLISSAREWRIAFCLVMEIKRILPWLRPEEEAHYLEIRCITFA